MVYTRHCGSEQYYQWLQHPRKLQKSLAAARKHVIAGEFDQAEKILKPIVKSNDAEALYLGALFSWKGETTEEFDKRHLRWIKLSAEKNYPPAIFVLAVYYDTGELVPLDKTKAAHLFKQAAELKHAHSQWIHGIGLLYGTQEFGKDERAGLDYIRQSAEAKFEGALETLAKFYEKGEFGFPINLEIARTLRQQATDDDAIGY
jgi:TPR repeat protein